MRFRLVPKSSTLDELELLYVQIFSEFCASRHVWEATTRDGVLEDWPRPRGQLGDKILRPWPWPWPRQCTASVLRSVGKTLNL